MEVLGTSGFKSNSRKFWRDSTRRVGTWDHLGPELRHATWTVRNSRQTFLRKMEAPSGFEPEMEVLQTKRENASC